MLNCLVQAKCSMILEHHYSGVQNDTDNIVEYNTLWARCKDICPDQKTMKLVLMQLAADKKVSLTEGGRHEMVGVRYLWEHVCHCHVSLT